ncbi:glutathione S-transferase N-terminal domain-containing protein [Pacificispira sp.]|uniref:glutathione S-transferase N-terminal domain-containing protein n=1 Tax=Pacificispira sp. TaxID=2888761 RepID=UPI003BA9847E
MLFYHSPRACSQAAHIMLYETRQVFEAVRVDIPTRETETGESLTDINPKGYVPALRLDDGSLLTENVAILDWLAQQRADLAPAGAMGRTRQIEMLAFLSTEIQKPFVRLMFEENAERQAEIAGILRQRFALLAARIQDGHLFGDAFTASDAFLYVMLAWARMFGVDPGEGFIPYIRRLEMRPAIRDALRAEGVAPMELAA